MLLGARLEAQAREYLRAKALVGYRDRRYWTVQHPPAAPPFHPSIGQSQTMPSELSPAEFNQCGNR